MVGEGGGTKELFGRAFDSDLAHARDLGGRGFLGLGFDGSGVFFFLTNIGLDLDLLLLLLAALLLRNLMSGGGNLSVQPEL